MNVERSRGSRETEAVEEETEEDLEDQEEDNNKHAAPPTIVEQ